MTMKIIFFTVVFMLIGCPKPMPPTPVPAMSPDLIYHPCTMDMGLPSVDDVCEALYTPRGDSCVNCKGTIGGCMDTVDVVYCAKGGCLNDPLCHLSTDDNSSVMSTKNRRK